MWGVDSISTTFSSGQTSDLGTIYLLRAVAKITVNLDSEASELGYSLTSATLSSYNTSGYCLPRGADTVSATKNLTRDSCIHIPADVTTGTTLSLVAASDTSLILYVPEMEVTADNDTVKGTDSITYRTAPYLNVAINKASTSTSSSLKTRADDSDDATYTKNIYFCQYEDGVATEEKFDLVRNHSYTFTLTSAELVVVDSSTYWTEQVSSVGWEVDDDNLLFIAADGSSTAAKVGDTDAEYCFLAYPRWDDARTSTNNSKSYASYEFTLKPDAQFSTGTITWQAYLTNTDWFSFNTNTNRTDISDRDYDYDYNVTTGVNRDSSYTIKVGPKGSRRWNDSIWSDGSTVMGIRTYIPDSTDCEYIIKADGEDTIRAVYTDLFILATGAGLTYPLNINPAFSGTDAIFSPNRFPGGTKDIYYIMDDGTHIILQEHQWIRIYWGCANTVSGANGYDDVLEIVTEASDDDEKWFIMD